jgi:hypothetical protein
MKKRMNRIGMALLGLSLMATPVLAADYSSMTTEELSSLRGTMRNATQEEHSAFQQEWQSRMQQMTPDERQKYMGRPDNAPRDGSGMQYGKNKKHKNNHSYANMNNGDPAQSSGMGGRGYGKGGGNR